MYSNIYNLFLIYLPQDFSVKFLDSERYIHHGFNALKNLTEKKLIFLVYRKIPQQLLQ